MRISLPSRFSDLTLRGVKAFHSSEDMVNRVGAVLGKTRVEVLEMPFPLVQEAHSHIERLMASETSRHLERFELGGVEYGFIPNWDELTMGEWIDLDNACSNFWSHSEKVMSILFRPITKTWGTRYEIAKYTAKENTEVFLEMPADQVAGALLFFAIQGTNS